MKRILVTGGAGFIGLHFIRHILDRYPNVTIVNLDLLTYAANPSGLKEVEEDPFYYFIRGDIADSEVVSKAMAGCDAVVHFAAESHVDRSIAGPAVFLRTNVIGTQVLLDEAVKQGVQRFLHFSTGEVFGSLPLGSRRRFTERTCYNPRSPYAASRAAADHLARAYYHTHGLPVVIINCSNNFGPYQHPEKFIPRAITNVLWGQPILIYGDGRNVRNWLYVLDSVLAIELVLLHGLAGETYLVGGMEQGISNLEVAQMIIRLMGRGGRGEIKHIRDRPGHDLRYDVDWSKIRHALGWEPQHSFEAQLASTIQWYRENEPWWAPRKREAEEFYAST